MIEQEQTLPITGTINGNGKLVTVVCVEPAVQTVTKTLDVHR